MRTVSTAYTAIWDRFMATRLTRDMITQDVAVTRPNS